MMIDVAITCPTGDTYVKAARTALGAATIREKQKIRKYESEVHKEGIEFAPFVVETTGGFGARAEKVVKAMVEETMASSNPGLAAGSVGQFIRRTISVAVQIGNAMVIQEGLRRSRGGGWKKKFCNMRNMKRLVRQERMRIDRGAEGEEEDVDSEEEEEGG